MKRVAAFLIFGSLAVSALPATAKTSDNLELCLDMLLIDGVIDPSVCDEIGNGAKPGDPFTYPYGWKAK